MDTIIKQRKFADRGINLYELKTQLAELGFVRPEITDRLREIVLSDNVRFNFQHRERNEQVTLDCWFDFYRKVPEGPVIFHSYDYSDQHCLPGTR